MHDQKDLWNNAHSTGDIQHYSTTPTEFATTALPLLNPNSKVLELGCGAGNDSIAFVNAGHSIIATDFSEVAIEKNRERFKDISNLTFKTLDMNQPFELEPNSFDAVYARLSLHYFPDTVTKRIIEDIYKLLKQDGLLFFMCKSTSDSLYGKGEKIEDNMYQHEGHIRHFFSKEYAKQCLGDKFKITKLEEKTDLLYGKSSSFIEVITQKA